MNFQEILVDSSRKLIEIVANEVGNDECRFREILNLSFAEQISNRASRVAYFSCLQNPVFFQKYSSEIINHFYTIKDKSVIRNLLGIVYEYIENISDEEQQGKIVDLCFNWLNPKEPIALRYYSMKIIFCLTKKYPELIPEFAAILENTLIDGSTGLKNQSNKLLRKLH